MTFELIQRMQSVHPLTSIDYDQIIVNIIVARFGNQKTGTGLEHARKLFDHAPFCDHTH